jgi:alpha-tubulin suppressor-like RCC1 family protein
MVRLLPILLIAAAPAIDRGGQTCTPMPDGSEFCWDTGDTPTDSGDDHSVVPQTVADLHDVVAIDAGHWATCAIRSDGELLCWGDAEGGRLGTGDESGVLGPTPTRLPVRAVDVTLGWGDHACAVDAESDLWCWGSNRQGELGVGYDDSAVPAHLTSAAQVAEVAAGEDHTCARHLNGRVSCWGSQADGCLGAGRRDGPALWPVRAGQLEDAVELVTGSRFTCALHRDGRVSCWGRVPGRKGRDRHRPAMLTPHDDVVTLAAGLRHLCALRAGGDVICWGAHRPFVESDFHNDGSRSRPLGAQRVPFPGAVRALTAGEDHSCGLLVTGHVACWGDNDRGQLGDGTTVARVEPVLVRGLADAVAIDAGDGHTCAIRERGSVVCWGDDRWGQLGNRARSGANPDDR